MERSGEKGGTSLNRVHLKKSVDEAAATTSLAAAQKTREELRDSLEESTRKWAAICSWTEFRDSNDYIEDILDVIEIELEKAPNNRRTICSIEVGIRRDWRRRAASKLGLWFGQFIACLGVVVGILTLMAFV